MSPSGKRRPKILGVLSRGKAERFLLDFANLGIGVAPDDLRDRAEYLMKLYCNDLLLDHVNALAWITPSTDEEAKEILDGSKKLTSLSTALLLNLRNYLRKAWTAPDARQRDWYIFLLRFWATQTENRVKEAVWAKQPTFEQLYTLPPKPTPFEAALYYLQYGIGDRAVRCANRECKQQPFFIRPRGKAQKFCSPECAADADRENKKLWWREHHGQGELQ